MFWSTTYAVLGYIFTDQLGRVAVHVIGIGTVLALAVALGLGFHIVRKVTAGDAPCVSSNLHHSD
jgi:hypothetical protein